MMKARQLFPILLALLLASASVVNAQFSLVSLAHTNSGGYALDIAKSGNTVYVAYNTGLYISDVSNPASPVALGHTNVSHAPDCYGIEVVGNYLYWVDAYGGLFVCDVSNPANPFNVGHTNAVPYTYGLAVSGNYAYLAGSYQSNNILSELRIIDISNPAQPVPVGMGTNYNSAFIIAMSGHYAFLGEYNGIRVYDVLNPAVPVKVAFTNNSGYAYGFVIAGNYAYVAGPYTGLNVFDISDPTNLKIVGHTDVLAYGGAAVSSNFLYLANSNDGLRLYDISDPTTPVNVGQAHDGGQARNVVASGNYVYLANGNDGLRIYQIVPQLKIQVTGTNTVLISWPVPPVNNLTLQQTFTLPATDWTDVTNMPLILSNRNYVVLPFTNSSSLFRLKSP